MAHLTIRRVPKALADALDAERRRRGASINQTVIDLLATALGLGPEPLDNGLGAMAGTWTAADLAEFEGHVPPRRVDGELWR